MTPKTLPYRPCAGAMLINRRGEVFVGQRLDTPSPAWQMPQGGIDSGETPQQAALRELHEETGVAAELVEVIGETTNWLRYDFPPEIIARISKGRYRGQEQKWVLMRFHGDDAQINIATAHPEFSAWRWLPADQLVKHIVPFKRQVYEQILLEFDGFL